MTLCYASASDCCTRKRFFLHAPVSAVFVEVCIKYTGISFNCLLFLFQLPIGSNFLLFLIENKLKENDEEMRKMENTLRRLKKMVYDKNLGERSELAKQLATAEDKLYEAERKNKVCTSMLHTREYILRCAYKPRALKSKGLCCIVRKWKKNML